jgi:hypothetical protein
MSDGHDDSWWERNFGRSAAHTSPWKGRRQPVCGVCGRQIKSESDLIRYGKHNYRHAGCKPATGKTVETLEPPQKVKKSCKGKRRWRKRHPEF